VINVTQTYLPPFDEYAALLQGVWDRRMVTNNGPLLRQLELKLKDHLNLKNLLYCSNGTIALQLALKALDISGEVITTPFSYVATTHAILWEGCKPVFVDVRPGSLCIDEEKIEAAITKNTQAIMATHVYGYPCNVQAIGEIAARHHLKVIYDAAHAFGCKYNGQSILGFGDVSTCSFHATKIFHTVEGGCVVSADDDISKKVSLIRSFGHIADDYQAVGINGKNSEVHAAMGLSILPKMNEIISYRKHVSELYDQSLDFNCLKRPTAMAGTEYNYAYYPVIFETEEQLKNVQHALLANQIAPRRYFYPSLNRLSYLRNAESCPISESSSVCVLCLPLYHGLPDDDVIRISDIINSRLRK
jgi:dTDP-4-amino-4,6-dideoxygalactose transaminase